MKQILTNKKIWIVIISIITTIGISMELIDGKFRFFGNDFKWIVILTALIIIFHKAIQNINKRKIICSAILGGVLATFYIIGYEATVTNFAISKKHLLLAISKWEVWFIIITALTSIVFTNVPNAIEKLKANKEYKFFTANKKSLIAVAGLLFVAYIPYLLHYYPGNVLIDSVIQILQGQGAIELTNHHPVLHTLIITICMNIGHGLTNSYAIGAFIYTFTQTIATALIFSFGIYYMARKKVPVGIRVIALLFYMFCPTIGFFTITMYKDIPFALMMLLATIGLTEMITNTERFFKSKTRFAFLMLAITFAMFFRNNGVYAIILTFPFILIAFRNYYKKVLILFLIPIIFYEIVTGPIYNACNIKQGSTKEALSIPIQQFARVMTKRESDLTEEQKNKIRQYLPIEDFSTLYDEVFADPVKSKFSEEGFEQDKAGLVKLYIELALEFPVETIESFIMGSFGYYYPNTVGWGIYTGVNTDEMSPYDEYKFEKHSIIEIKALDKLNEFVNTRDFPIVSMFISVGFLFWILLACITYLAYTKEYRKILIFLPVIFVWLTALASPVFCEPRYVYSLFTCLPLFIGITAKKPDSHI